LTDGAETPESSTAERKGWSIGRVAAICAFLVIAGIWALLLSPFNDPTHPDELNDETFAEAADARCEDLVDEIDALPKANTVETPAERALLVDAGTALTVELVEDLGDLAPSPSTDDGQIVALWLDDWQIYISDRDAYAAALSGGETGPFPVSARDGEQISEFVDAFAEVNGMINCFAPLDV
jgi:hypothetical protein